MLDGGCRTPLHLAVDCLSDGVKNKEILLKRTFYFSKNFFKFSLSVIRGEVMSFTMCMLCKNTCNLYRLILAKYQ